MTSFFDSNCVIGMRSVRRSGVAGEAEFYSLESLLAEMDYAGVGDALVYHSLAKEYVPMLGNRQLMDEISGHERLHPCWVVMPHGTGEMPRPEALVNEMIERGVKAARLFPSDHLFSLADWCSGELLTQLEKRGIVVIIQIDQIGWDGLYSLCSRYPDLCVIITNLSYRINRYLYPLLEKFRNVYVETSGYQIHKGMETLCAKFGADRVIFGTRMPFFTPGPAVNMINYSLISTEEKEMIAGGNLGRLLGCGRTHRCAPTEVRDIKETAMLARALEGELVIDAHTHMGSYFNFHIPDNGADSMVAVMDRLGVKMACTSPHVGITPDFRMGNDMAAKAVQDYPGRFFGYITINGNYPDEIPEEIERCYNMGMRGFKIHPSLHGYPADGENLRPMWEYANNKGLPVLSHAWSGADRILFGSDMPFVNANAQIDKILYARIPDQDKRKILGLNMAKIIGL